MFVQSDGVTRPRWADLQDSSQENLPDSDQVPVSQGSYRGLSQDSPEDLRSLALSEHLTRATSLRSAPRPAPHAGRPQPAEFAEAAAEDEVAEDTIETTATSGTAAIASVSPQGGAGFSEVWSPLSDRLRAWRPISHEPAERAMAASRCISTNGAPAAAASGPSSIASETGDGRPPPFTPSRRRTRQRYEAQMNAQTPGGKRLRSTVTDPPNPWAAQEATPEDWERRLRKRQAAVVAIKAMPEYEKATALREVGAVSAEELPLTPDPEDTSASKRQWESSVMQWRSQLRQLVEIG